VTIAWTERRVDYNKASGGITADNRRLLQILHRNARGLFTVRDAADAWQMPPERAGRLLRSLAAGGWLTRARRGLYIPVPLEAARSGDWHEDPWLIAAKLFPGGYIGGWSACEHWELTDQLFRDVMVYNPRRMATKTIDVDGTTIQVKLVSEGKLFGLRSIWRSTAKVTVSDPTRTVIDILDEPISGGGIRHVVDVIDEYFRSSHRDDALLVTYGDRFGNRAIFKRLGYIVETLGVDAPDLVASCTARMSRGISLLDPSAGPSGHILTRWNLRLNVGIGR
jgi:predicted transcriptional regulator of viral defense system